MTVAHDKKFFDTFMLVLGILVGIAIILYILARVVATDTQVAEVQASDEMKRAISDRIKPLAKVAVSGQDNSALEPQRLRTWAAKKRSSRPARPATAPVSRAPRKSATPRRGDRASRKAPTRCTSTRSKASRARLASCLRRAAPPIFPTSRS